LLCQATARTDERAIKVASIGRAISASPKQMEDIVINRSKLIRESGMTYPWALAVAGFALCAVLVTGALAVRTTAVAAPSVSTERVATEDSATVYFPAQFVNQATEIEPMPPTF
jgi:hypothetical protein